MTGIISITGGKGGTGKSTFAVMLALKLSEKSKVLLVDADVDCPNDHLILATERDHIDTVFQRIAKIDKNKCKRCSDCEKACMQNAIAAVKGKDPIFFKRLCNGCGACRIVCKHDAISFDRKKVGDIFFSNKGKKKQDIDLLSGELSINEPMSEIIVSKLNDKINDLKSKYDHIIIDTAAGTHCPVIEALTLADKVFAVTEASPLGAHDLDLILQLLKKIGKSSSIILNKSDIGKKDQIKEISEKYDLKISLEIPFSKGIIDSYSKGDLNSLKDAYNLDIKKVLR